MGLAVAAVLALALLVLLPSVVTFVPRSAKVEADFAYLHREVRLHLLERGELPGSLGDLLHDGRQDPWGQPYLYLPRRDAQGIVTDYALVSLGAEGGDGGTIVDWGDGQAVQLPRSAQGPSGLGLGHLLPPLLSAGLAGALGLGVWWFGRMPALRRAGVVEPPAWTPGAPRGPRVAVHRVPATIHCAWCRDDESELPLLACRGCGTALHPECWGLAGLCPTLGCRRRAKMANVDRSEPVDALGGQA